MNNPKWITKLTATTPLRKAANIALTNRFQFVLDHLPAAVERPEEDVEYVHQLRVGTRRAAAALRLFAGCLAEKNRKSADQELKQVRRAAGAARDWDVFLAGLEKQSEQDEVDMPAIDFLRGYALKERLRAQDRLVASAPQPVALHKILEKTVGAIKAPKRKGARLIDLAEPRLSKALDNLSKAASADLTSDKNLHQVRIEGKRLRYLMDLFAHCFDSDFREKYYPAVEDVQKILGHANDSYNANEVLKTVREKASGFLGSKWERYKGTWEKLQRDHQERWESSRSQLKEWFVKWLQPTGEPALRRMLATAPKRGQLLILQGAEA